MTASGAKSSSFISVVVVVDNDAAVLDSFTNELLEVLRSSFSTYEVVFVDQASTDGTPEIIDELLQSHECLRLLRISRRYGAEIAIAAGLDSALGDFTLVMAPAWDPPQAVLGMVAMAEAGADVVLGTCRNRPGQTLAYRFGRWAYFQFCRRLLEWELPEDIASMRLFSRKALNAVTRIRQKALHNRLVSCTMGFPTRFFDYEQRAGFGRAKQRSLHQALAEGVSMLVSSSMRPLRMVSYLGMAASAFNLLYMVYILAVNLFKEKVSEGWTTLSLQMAVMFLFTSSTLVVLAEYLAHMLEEVKDRPLYHVSEEKSSSTLQSDRNKKNVFYESAQPESPRRKAG